MQVTSCLLSFESNLESLACLQIGEYYVREIKDKSIEVQKEIDERNK